MNITRSTLSENVTIHAIGNGKIVVYQKGPQIFQIVGFPYSANSFGSVQVQNITDYTSRRIPHTDIFEHKIGENTILTDLADAYNTCFIRQVKTKNPIKMRLSIDPSYTVNYTPFGNEYKKAKGSVQFFCYTSASAEVCYCFNVSDNVSAKKTNDYEWEFTFNSGESYLYFANSQEIISQEKSTDFKCIYSRTEQFWKDYLKQQKNIPDKLNELCESVAVMIKAQQGEDGGIMAGYPYHLAYVRDQYGTARGLLKMGFYDTVKDILNYYLCVFNEHGTLHNAQSIGIHDVFHIHENDASEITGYISLMPFDFFKATGDKDFTDKMLPLVRWAIDSQIKILKNNMMPFNGDETYIAGHFLPRSCMYDGSMEATMLLAEGIKRYREYTGCFEYDNVYDGIVKTFADNFIKDGILITNNLHRENYSDYPPTRFGVCEGCESYFGHINKTDTHRYICPNCANSGITVPKREEKTFSLASSLLTSVYVGSTLIPKDILYANLDKMVQIFHQTGQLPSGCKDGECVGYDYGFLLYAATVLNHPSAKEFYTLALSVADEIGTWAEYYKNSVPYNTRCRPWESAINIEAVLEYSNK